MRRRMLHNSKWIELAVCFAGQRNEIGILADGCEDRIDASFHHLFRADRLKTFVFEEMAFQQTKRLVSIPSF